MIIGLLSDTHDQVARTRSVVSLLVAQGAEAILHCGDITTPEVVHECSLRPSFFVLGNCDHDHRLLAQAIEQIGGTCLGRGGIVELGGRRIAMTHGHLDSEIWRLAALEPDYLLSGHTHHPHDIQKGPTRWINPGAVYRASPRTAATLDLASSHLSVLPIIDEMMRD